MPVADPRFPVGGRGPRSGGGGVDSQGDYVLKILHVKMKESGPLGGARTPDTSPLDPPMNANRLILFVLNPKRILPIDQF